MKSTTEGTYLSYDPPPLKHIPVLFFLDFSSQRDSKILEMATFFRNGYLFFGLTVGQSSRKNTVKFLIKVKMIDVVLTTKTMHENPNVVFRPFKQTSQPGGMHCSASIMNNCIRGLFSQSLPKIQMVARPQFYRRILE